MARPLVAIALDLDYPARRHLDVLAGIQGWVNEHDAWDFRLDEKIVHEPGGRLGRYAGVIARATPALASAARKRGVPVVNVWQKSPVAGKLAGVFPDGKSIGTAAAHTLLMRGFSSFACSHFSDDVIGSQSADSFRRTIERARPGLPVACLPVRFDEAIPILSDELIGRFDTWVTGLPRPVGLFCSFSGTVSRYICEELHALELRVPEDVAIVVDHDEPLICGLLKPTLTAVDVPYAQIGFTAAGLLDEMIRRPKVKPRTIRVPAAGVIARDSTDLFPVDDDLVRSILRYVEGNLAMPLEPGSLAKRFNVSRRTLDRRFQEGCHRTVSDVVRDLRFERARQLLVNTTMLVKEIAREVGMTKFIQIHQLIKQKTGMGPAEYRRMMQPPGHHAVAGIGKKSEEPS
jgi:LacI family transcriptional regulator